MKQRLGIANVLIKEPKLIILDEPTQGIDPRGIQEILDLFTRINKESGTTIMLSSHLIHHVQQICDNIGIMSQGKMRVRAKLDLIELNTGQDWITEFEIGSIPYGLEKKIEEISQIKFLEKNGGRYIAHSSKDIRSEISKTIIENGGTLLSLNLQERSLINIYKKYSEEN
jgi:ABC-2 type transport system ATP-binding protein